MSELFIHTVRNIHAVGRNYVKHIQELGNDMPDEPVVFSKSPATLTNAVKLCFPPAMNPVHFELELVLRLGESADAGSGKGLELVSHMALGIDFTARDRQSHFKEKKLPWHLAKNFRDGCWLGPLTTQFKIHEPFSFQLYQNGTLRQDGDSRHMMYDFQKMITFINRTLPFMEGDLIYSGTPAGVGPVQEGDRLRLVCEALQTDLEIEITFG